MKEILGRNIFYYYSLRSIFPLIPLVPNLSLYLCFPSWFFSEDHCIPQTSLKIDFLDLNTSEIDGNSGLTVISLKTSEIDTNSASTVTSLKIDFL